MRTIKPISNHLLVSHVKPALMTKGGLHLLENANYSDDQMQWRVLAVGPKVTDIQVGDYLVCPMYQGNKLVLEDGTERYIITDKDAVAVVRNEDEKATA